MPLLIQDTLPIRFSIVNRLVLKITCTVLLLTSLVSSYGQENLIIPRRGISTIPIVIDTSSATHLTAYLGGNFRVTRVKYKTTYHYDSLGLSFDIDPYDKNQIIRSIYIQYPFKGRTINGIVLNESTAKDLENIYGNVTYFPEGEYVRIYHSGISYYIKLDSRKKKKKINRDERISRIRIDNDGQYGSTSTINFEFNNEPVEKKLNELISILRVEPMSFQKLEAFWAAEAKTESEPYGIRKQTKLNRKIEMGMTQEFMQVEMVRKTVHLNLVKSGDKLIHVRLSEANQEKDIYERVNTFLLDSIVKSHDRSLDTSSLLSIPFNLIYFGAFCGIGGSPPVGCKSLLRLVNDNNYEEISTWLFSLNPEIAAYGYMGLDFLRRKGIDIKPSEVARMNELLESNIELNTCKGCFYGLPVYFRKELARENLDNMYKNFVQTGHLNRLK